MDIVIINRCKWTKNPSKRSSRVYKHTNNESTWFLLIKLLLKSDAVSGTGMSELITFTDPV
jgi:hypothetical protein